MRGPNDDAGVIDVVRVAGLAAERSEVGTRREGGHIRIVGVLRIVRFRFVEGIAAATEGEAAGSECNGRAQEAQARTIDWHMGKRDERVRA